MPKRAVFERSRRELSLNVSVGVHILLVVEQSSLESQSRGCVQAPILVALPALKVAYLKMERATAMPEGIAIAMPVSRPQALPRDSISCVGHVSSAIKNTPTVPTTKPTATQTDSESVCATKITRAKDKRKDGN